MHDSSRRVLVFGAGNIGRSFIGQVFSRGGWKVTFVDVDRGLVAALNERGRYEVVIKQQGQSDGSIMVEGVDAIDGRDYGAVAAAVAGADCLATSVGKAALPLVLPPIAAGLALRGRRGPAGGAIPPLDLILAENDREAVNTARDGLRALLPAGFPLAERLGLVETSIGKMVPIMRKDDLERDRLRVFAEAYNSLIVDGRGFLGELPDLPDLKPVDNILAYVDRKLFIHNLGHATVAWAAFARDPGLRLICEALDLDGIRDLARDAMREAAEALAVEYPDAYGRAELEKHIEDLLSRFANTALGDTVFRVGKDLPRKLHRSDRVVGAALLCERQGKPWDAVSSSFAAALGFRAADEDGQTFPADDSFHAFLEARGPRIVLAETCGLEDTDPLDRRVIARLARSAGAGSSSR